MHVLIIIPRDVKRNPRERLPNLWHAYPKWQAESFPQHAAFTAIQISLFLLPDYRLHIVKNMCIYIYT